jgi:pyrimidine-nucleoside phosphorylase
MHIPSLIEKKRDGGSLADAEIAELIAAYAAGEVPDYQMSAFAMAVFFQGMSDGETSALTAAMRDSGRVFRWPEGSPPKVDKHSTGGIGDKVSLVLAPLLACDGLWVPMVSGRGLGITGGTLDKLESIPGFNVHLDEAACLRQIEKIGVFMAGQTEDFCPADKRLYALRDVTATVPSRPLIIASIMSKKLAESLDRLVLDVKFGSGAFMKTREDAELLAAGLAAAGEGNGVRTSFLLSPMGEPLGRAVGNALEVREAVETLQGNGPDDLVAITLDLAAAVSDSPRDVHAKRLRDGSAWRKFIAMVEAQGGDPRPLENRDHFHPAPVVRPLPAPHDGVVVKMDAGSLGMAAVQLGAGRHKADDAINHAVGFSGIRKIGERISKGEPLLVIHAASEADADAASKSVNIEVRTS